LNDLDYICITENIIHAIMLYVYKFSKGRREREGIEHKENDRGERISNVNLKEKVGIR
jgi:hypothetical protein